MGAKCIFANTHRSILDSSLFLQTFAGIVPAQTGVTDWSSFARSLNNTFDPSRAYTIQNAVLLVILILMLTLPLVLIRWYFSKEVQEQRQEYKQFRERRSLQKALQPVVEQQRNWFRLPIHLGLRWIPEAQASKTPERLYKKDKLCDISGGGLCFTTAAQLNPGEEIIILLEPVGIKPFRIHGQILRVEASLAPEIPEDNYDDLEAPTPIPEPFEVAVEFVRMSLGEQERLISWIAQGQRDVIHDQKQEEASPEEDFSPEEESTPGEDLQEIDSLPMDHEQPLDV